MGETLAIPPAATGDLLVITTHSGEQKFTGIREMRISKQNLAYEDPEVQIKSQDARLGILFILRENAREARRSQGAQKNPQRHLWVFQTAETQPKHRFAALTIVLMIAAMALSALGNQ